MTPLKSILLATCAFVVSTQAAAQTAPAPTTPVPPGDTQASSAATAAAPDTAATSSENQLDDIVVTAQKRRQSAQDVGITLSVFDAEGLASRNVQSVADAVVSIPQVQVNQTSDLVSFNFRGIGISEFTVNLDPPIAVNIDDIYQSKTFMTGVLLYDIDRVEALKGPQGTLYGRNATGGAVNFFTNRPTREFSTGGTVGFDNYRTLRSEGYISGPLGGDFSARLSGMYTNQGKGFYRNLNIGGTDGRERKWAVRGQLQYANAGTNILLIGHYGKDTSIGAPDEGLGIFTPASFAAGAPVRCADYNAGNVNGALINCVRGTDGRTAGDTNPYTTFNDQRARLNVKHYGVSLHLSQDLGWGTITSITAFDRASRNWREDSDGTPIPTIDGNYNGKIDQFTQELRLNGRSGSWNYVLGGFYEHDRYRNDDYIVVGGGAGTGLYSPFTQKVDAVALFAHNEIGVTKNLNIIAGVRYSNEKVSINGATYLASGVIAPPGLPTTIGAKLADSSGTSDGGQHRNTSTTFKIGLEWSPQINSPSIDRLLLYANVSTGFRSGGYNAEFVGSQGEFTSLRPENITAYEAGFKSTLFGRKMTLNGSAFYYDFTDAFVRVDSPTTIVSVTINAGAIRSYGGELDLAWQPVKGLRFNASGGYLSSTITSNLSINGVSIKGNHTINSPAWTAAFDGQYELPVSNNAKLIIGADANYRSLQYLETSNAPITREPGYWVAGARLGVTSSDGRLSLTGWVKNLFDEHYRVYVHDLPGFGFVINLYGHPRTYGATLGVKF